MINYVGIEKLKPLEIKRVHELSQRYFSKFKRDFKDSNLTVTIKKYDSNGKSKFSVHARLETPDSHNILLAKQADWDLSRALHKTFRNLENAINHIFKREVTKRRKLKF